MACPGCIARVGATCAAGVWMFTGIVTDIGRVLGIEAGGDLGVRIATAYDLGTIDLGASIACDGICLTVTQTGTDPEPWFAVDLSAETQARTAAADWREGRPVNLERSLRLGDEMGGHIVLGHVDGVAEVLEMVDEGESTRVMLAGPAPLARYVAPKGSIALNGTSLTVNEVDGARFGVNLIPHTKAVTTWAGVAAGDRVNVEVDTVARYVARLADQA